MEPYLYLIKILEHLGLGEFAEAYPHVVYSWFTMLLLILLAFLATRCISLVPGKMQNVFEVLISGLEDFTVGITGEEGRQFFPLLATAFIFVAACNLIGIIPGFLPPTASLSMTLALALVVVVFTHVIGIKYHGIKYIKHFIGPVWWLVPLFFIIEIIGHVARVMSLSMRLFGNMMGHELVLAILFILGGAFLLPLPIMAMGVFVAIVQAFVFFLLSIMYFTGAMEHAH